MNDNTIFLITKTIIKAGDAILEVYNTADFGVEYKKDESPLTLADTASHNVIQAELEVLTLDGEALPILSEEGRDIPFEQRSAWAKFWLVDPLDGTKEFIMRNGEFTVNIALIEDGAPAAGFVYIPVTDILYYGVKETGSFIVENASTLSMENFSSSSRELKPAELSGIISIVASRSHLSPETEDYIKKAEKKFDNVETVSSGSSIKLCMVADGSAHVYPRFAPTMEWDTAAAHAVCKFAGVNVINYDTKKELNYNKQNLLNPWFLVYQDGVFAEMLN